ncbi:glutamine amidotransferase [Sodalis ligni]|jgi:GMP synthase (glutamine-hydrolysing)|uniref:glutamine amidotransferase n=1 Tax=Sodalis TaxID=84565 RepID=UPI00193F5173|nr:glutamine amidotransferase [Sodalis ligni]QWA11851.1 glutamine amidotransferase [Sodalis ligni]
MARSLPVLILQTGDAPEEVSQANGNYDRMFLAAAGLRPEQAAVVHLPSGERPQEPGAYGGVLITGSSAMVTDRLPWSEFAAGWLRQAMAERVPIFGVCYGHQLLAYAMGGEVDYHPGGMELGTLDIELLPAAGQDPLLASLTQGFPVNLIHSQTVLTPPPEAVVLARSQRDPHQILRYGENTITVQFHPEFTAEVMHGFLRSMTEEQPERELELARVGTGISGTPQSRDLMATFVNRYILRKGS